MCSSHLLNSSPVLFSIVFHCDMTAFAQTTVTLMSKDRQLILSLTTFRENTLCFFVWLVGFLS